MLGIRLKKSDFRDGAMCPWLKTLLLQRAEVWFLSPTHCLTTAHNYKSRESDALCGPFHAPVIHMVHVHNAGETLKHIN